MKTTEQLVEQLKAATWRYNNLPYKRERQAVVPLAEALRKELARRGRVVTVEELAAFDPDEGDSFVGSDLE